MSEIEQLREELATTRAELDAYRERYQKALERARLLELGILAGRKSERLHGDDEAQMSMQLLALLKGAEEDGVSVVVVEDGPHDADDDAPGDAEGQLEGARARGRGRARRALPEALPRVEIEVTPPEVQEEGLAAFRRIGEEVSEVVERRPASLVRQTICDWHLQLAELCAPLVDAMMVDAFTAPYVCVDATSASAGRSSARSSSSRITAARATPPASSSSPARAESRRAGLQPISSICVITSGGGAIPWAWPQRSGISSSRRRCGQPPPSFSKRSRR